MLLLAKKRHNIDIFNVTYFVFFTFCSMSLPEKKQKTFKKNNIESHSNFKKKNLNLKELFFRHKTTGTTSIVKG